MRRGVSLSKKSPGEFERAAALSFSIIFSDMRGENAGFPKEQTLAFAVGNPFSAPPSLGNAAAFQKAGPQPSKNVSFSMVRRPFAKSGGALACQVRRTTVMLETKPFAPVPITSESVTDWLEPLRSMITSPAAAVTTALPETSSLPPAVSNFLPE